MPAQRRFRPDDLYLLKNVSDPQVSPDGRLVAYVVSWPDRADDETGGLPQENMQTYIERSPTTYLANVNTPVLLLHHEGDLRCPIAQSEEIFHALKAMGKEVEFVRYPGGFHTYNTHAPSQVVDRIKRQIAWFESHKPARRPSRALRHGSGQASG